MILWNLSFHKPPEGLHKLQICLIRERSLTIGGGGVNFGGGLCFFGRPFGVGHNFMGPRLGEGYNFWAPFIKTLDDVHKWVLCYWLWHGKRIFIESYTQSLISQWKSSHLKITFVWFLVVQHSNFQNFFTGEDYNFLGSHFKRGRDFWAVNRRGAKIFGL